MALNEKSPTPSRTPVFWTEEELLAVGREYYWKNLRYSYTSMPRALDEAQKILPYDRRRAPFTSGNASIALARIRELMSARNIPFGAPREEPKKPSAVVVSLPGVTRLPEPESLAKPPSLEDMIRALVSAEIRAQVDPLKAAISGALDEHSRSVARLLDAQANLLLKFWNPEAEAPPPLEKLLPAPPGAPAVRYCVMVVGGERSWFNQVARKLANCPVDLKHRDAESIVSGESYDLVICSKWVPHKQWNRLSAKYGANATFVTGGVSAVVNKIVRQFGLPDVEPKPQSSLIRGGGGFPPYQ